MLLGIIFRTFSRNCREREREREMILVSSTLKCAEMRKRDLRDICEQKVSAWDCRHERKRGKSIFHYPTLYGHSKIFGQVFQ